MQKCPLQTSLSINPKLEYDYILHSIELQKADVAELVDALDLGSSIFDVEVRVLSSALIKK